MIRIRPYEEFIEEIKKENQDMFGTLGESYFKEVYDNYAKTEEQLDVIKTAFDSTPLEEESCLVDLSNLNPEEDYSQKLYDKAQLFGQVLMMTISEKYDALYVCPEIASFMQLSPFFKRVEKGPYGVYKFGIFGKEDCNLVDCYKVPNKIAEKDCILLHTKKDEWKKVGVKIHDFFERKAELNVKDKGNDFEEKELKEIVVTKESLELLKAVNETLDFMYQKAENSVDPNVSIAWSKLADDFYEEFTNRYTEGAEDD